MRTQQSNCRVCDATTDGFACKHCTHQLERAVGDLPSLLEDLNTALTRQTRVYRSARPAKPQDEQQDPEQHLPAMLRSKDGRIALRAFAMPVDLDASELVWIANNTLTAWARHLAESRGVTEPTAERLLSWLLSNIEAARWDEAAAEIHDEITSLHHEIERFVDRSVPDVYAGTCDADDVILTTRLLVGAPCSYLTCSHESCESVRMGEAIIDTRAGVCGADLHARPGAVSMQCESCGEQYNVAERKEFLLGKVDDEWARPQAIASALSSLDEPVNADTVRKWIERGYIKQRGIDDHNKALYRVGDVRDRVRLMRERRAERLAS